VIGTGFGVYRLTRPPPPNLGGIADPGGDSQKGKATPQVAQPESKVSPGDVPVREVKADVPSGLRYVLVPAGHGNVGISPGETPTTDAPWHDFETAGFWLGETEVTVAAYRKFAVDTQRPLPQPPIIAGKAFNPEWQLRDLPMVMVDWQDASDFCKWDGGRLPGEFEWEYGGRAGSAAPAYGPMDEIGWFADNSGPAPFDATQLWNGEARKAWVRYEALVVARGSTIHPVAQKKPNGFGLFDMLGNVAEWTADSFRDGGMEKSIRGSAWGFTGPSRVSLRDRYAPTMRNGYLGFRCAIDPRR
jgi:formylglycine-generating enzyme required for sulfatase activity